MEIIQTASPRSRFLSWYGACLITASREIFEGGVPVKNLITQLVCVFFILGTSQVSDALTYKFEENILGVPFQATMEINVSEKMLTINLQNTSPIVAGPTIYGFGVSLKNYSSIASGLTWELQTGGGKDVAATWSKTGLILDASIYQLYFSTYSDIWYGLYNPDSKQFNSAYGSTPASLTAKFTLGDPEFNDSLAPVIRVGNVPGSSNPQYVKGTLVATPEPGTLLLLGLGLIGVALVMREML
jgi:hypothetical protein